MSRCVPDWDVNGEELDAVIPSSIDYLPPVKEETLPQKRSHLSDIAFARDRDVLEQRWMENGHVAMQEGHGSSKGNKPQWLVNYPHNWSSSGGQESEDGVTPSKPSTSSSPVREGNVVVSEAAADAPVNPTSVHDDEMVSWLQYPLDDSLERNYCSDFFGELPSSSISNIQLLKDTFITGQSAAARAGRNLNAGNGGSINRPTSADAAMAMGAGRAAGLLPQAGVEAFTKVRTTMQPQHSEKWPSAPNPDGGKSLDAAPTFFAQNASSPRVPPKSQAMSFQPPKSGPMNFSHFSRPAAQVRANLQCFGMSHGGIGTARPKTITPFSGGNQPLDASTSSGSSFAESTTTANRERNDAPPPGQDIHAERSEGKQLSLGTAASWPSMENALPTKDTEATIDRMDADESTPLDHGHGECRTPGGTSGMAPDAEKQVPGAEVQEAPEATVTSSSGGSGNSTDRGKGAASSGKRRRREGDESECQSEVSNMLQSKLDQVLTIAQRDGEDEMAEQKKPPQRGGTAKRSRAAEVHNLSERRRRDRINEKMKALQELIPNSNKTDKASMLDEAIEYLKMLQLQLQMMSMRSGMSIPSLVMPAGMQHLQMPHQMGRMPAMGMGMGMGSMMGMGMGMMDMSIVGPGRPPHLMPLPSHGGPSHSSVSATSPAVSMVDSLDHHRLQSSSVMDSLNVYLARQHQQLQLHPQPMNMDMYNVYMMQQQQQHHQLQQQHHQLQQQQQQHQLHHLPSSMPMGGGAPQ